MKYITTNIEKFFESNIAESEDLKINKYEIVTFNKPFTITNIFAGDRTINISVNKGDKAKLFFKLSESSNTAYCLKGIRPLDIVTNEAVSGDKDTFNIKELWVGNFILDKPMMLDSNSLPFTFEKYL